MNCVTIRNYRVESLEGPYVRGLIWVEICGLLELKPMHQKGGLTTNAACSEEINFLTIPKTNSYNEYSGLHFYLNISSATTVPLMDKCCLFSGYNCFLFLFSLFCIQWLFNFPKFVTSY